MSVNNLNQDLVQRIAELREQGLLRELRRVDSPQGTRIRIAAQELVNLSSNDYLGLANEPALKEAAQKAIKEFGAGAGASRLICGSLAPYHRLEEVLARFQGTEAALSFGSGYATALGTIGALLGKDDVIIADKLVHACVIDAARLSGATLRVFPHNDLNGLEKLLKWSDAAPVEAVNAGREQKRRRVLVVTESVFSMDGDLVPLRPIVELKEKYGAWLMLDEAHATGLYGMNRSGLAAACGLTEHIEIHMGTLGKALGAAGGYICGSRPLIEWLINRARSFIFSTAPVPASAAAACAAVELVQSVEGEHRRTRLWQRMEQMRTALAKQQWPLPKDRSAILPLMVGDAGEALRLASELRLLGYYVPAIRYPTVARGRARLRLTLSAAHSETDVAQFANALGEVTQPGRRSESTNDEQS